MNKAPRSSESVRRYANAAYWRLKTWFLRPLFGEVGRLVYGNDANLFNNIRSAQRLRRLQKEAGRPPVDDQCERLGRKLKSEGYLKFDAGYNPALLEEICRRFEQLIDDPQCSLVTAPNSASRRILEPINHILGLRELLTDEVRGILHAYYGTFFRVCQVTAWRNRHVPNLPAHREVYSNLWHCDEYLPYRTKLFVNLTDVTRETGAFRIHSVNSTKEIMRSGFLTRHLVLGRASRLLEDPERVVYAEGKVGTAILCNTNVCLHRAGIPCEGNHRDIAEFKFEPAATPLARDWYGRLEADPDALMYSTAPSRTTL